MPDHARSIAALLADCPVVLAPMEDISDAPFRRVCRDLGAVLCVTEFVRAEQLISGGRNAQRKASLTPDDCPTAIQIYGADPRLLLVAAAMCFLSADIVAP